MYQKLSQMIGGNIDNALSQNFNPINQIKIPWIIPHFWETVAQPGDRPYGPVN